MKAVARQRAAAHCFGSVKKLRNRSGEAGSVLIFDFWFLI